MLLPIPEAAQAAVQVALEMEQVELAVQAS
jgi:hypothetical protein